MALEGLPDLTPWLRRMDGWIERTWRSQVVERCMMTIIYIPFMFFDVLCITEFVHEVLDGYDKKVLRLCSGIWEAFEVYIL